MRVSQEYNLAKLHPNLAKEWHPKKNDDLTPYDVSPGSHQKVWWRCGEGHEWEARVASRANGRGCPYCSGRKADEDNNLAVKHPKLAKEWHPKKNDNLTPYDVSPGSNQKVWWKCLKNPKHEWPAIVASRANGTGCRECYRLRRKGK